MIRLIFLILFTTVSFAKIHSDGKLIAFAGISGSGKSTLSKKVGNLLNASVYCEPEENEWPTWVRKKIPYGEFSSYLTFRNMRVAALWQAADDKKKGKLAFLDSYYDKITTYYLQKEGMEWLIDPKDPYFEIVQQITALDKQTLPDADLIVLLHVSFEDWMKLLSSRGRARDSLEGFQESYSRYSSYIHQAVQTLSKERGIPFLEFTPTFGDPEKEAKKLASILSEYFTKTQGEKKWLLGHF